MTDKTACPACAHWRGLYDEGDDLEPRCDTCGDTGEVATWRTGDTIPGHILEVHGDNLHWRRCPVTDWWTAVAPDEERLHLPTGALLECYGTVSVHAEAVTA